jgi:hypothetical protein
MLKLNADGIMQMLEQDLTRITTWIENWKKQKDVSVVAQLESMLKSINLTTLGLSKEDFLKKRRQKALDSVRKIPFFGQTNYNRWPFDYEWPTKDEIQTMPLDKPLRAIAFKWHNSDNDQQGNYIGAI